MVAHSSDKTYAMFLDIDDDVSKSDARLVAPHDEDVWDLDTKKEAKLAVDVLQDDTHVFVISAMAGAAGDSIDVYVHNDLLTIRGKREHPFKHKKNISSFYEECYWGVFSRSIVLPVDVKGDLAQAEYKNGILTVRIPKQDTQKKIHVEIVDE